MNPTEPSFAQSQQIAELPVPNLPLLRKVLDHIDAHPEEWNQASFEKTTDCGTTHCVAGHAVAFTEGVMTLAVGGGTFLQPASGRHWEDAGREQLGLTAAEAEDLFYNTLDNSMATVDTSGCNTVRESVQRVAEGIAARAGERL